MSPMLRVVNLSVKVNDRNILNNISLYIKKGNVYVLFGPNGSGKSTLLNAILGNPRYKIISGRIFFKKKDITDLPPYERVRMGIGIAFQNPPKISGVKLIDLLRFCARIGNYSEDEIFKLAERLNLKDLLYRDVNLGFSGGEIKRSEILQIMLMNPDFVMLDEPDSGVDLENLSLIGKTINELLQEDKKSGIIITHTGQILDYIDADYGVIIYHGRIACIGDPEDILNAIRENGYEGCIRKCLTNL